MAVCKVDDVNGDSVTLTVEEGDIIIGGPSEPTEDDVGPRSTTLSIGSSSSFRGDTVAVNALSLALSCK